MGSQFLIASNYLQFVIISQVPLVFHSATAIQTMMRRGVITVIGLILTNVLVAQNYLVQVGNNTEGGSDYARAVRFRMEQAVSESGKGLTHRSMFRSSRRRNIFRSSRRRKGEKLFVGSTLTLACKPRRNVDSCEFRSPTGEVFKISENVKDLSGRIESIDKLFPSVGCGIRVKQVVMEDAGDWSCHIKLPGVPKIITRKQNVKVYERPGTAVKKGKLIGHIPSWGPYFKISFDLRVFGRRKGWTNVLSFKGNGGNSNCCNKGDRVPAVFLNEDGRLYIVNSVGGNGNHGFESSNQERIRPGKWYKVTIEQVSQAGKTFFNVYMDGTRIHSVPNSDPGTFTNVKVFACDKFHNPADVSYKNLVWGSSWDQCPSLACPLLQVQGAGDRDGDYEVMTDPAPWALHRPIYKNFWSDTYLYWSSKPDSGWCFGTSRSSEVHAFCSFGQTGLSEVCEPWQEKWKIPKTGGGQVSVSCTVEMDYEIYY